MSSPSPPLSSSSEGPATIYDTVNIIFKQDCQKVAEKDNKIVSEETTSALLPEDRNLMEALAVEGKEEDPGVCIKWGEEDIKGSPGGFIEGGEAEETETDRETKT